MWTRSDYLSPNFITKFSMVAILTQLIISLLILFINKKGLSRYRISKKKNKGIGLATI